MTFAKELEWIFAAVWSNDTPREFRAQEGEYQSEIIAAYRIKNYSEAVIAWKQRQDAEWESRHSLGHK